MINEVHQLLDYMQYKLINQIIFNEIIKPFINKQVIIIQNNYQEEIMQGYFFKAKILLKMALKIF